MWRYTNVNAQLERENLLLFLRSDSQKIQVPLVCIDIEQISVRFIRKYLSLVWHLAQWLSYHSECPHFGVSQLKSQLCFPF